ncbi:DinB family protein [Pseudoclavibacter endophyticus]|nr:DinB family protein [Pseudoclavibacter endophyticus]
MSLFMAASERDLLERMLDHQREQIAAVLDDVTEDEARARLVTSLTTLLGIVKHATWVDRIWFEHRVAGTGRDELGLAPTIDASFALEPADSIHTIRQGFVNACERSREIAATHHLDEEYEWRGKPVTLRFIYAQLIQEYARHAGHADIVREQLAARRDPQG